MRLLVIILLGLQLACGAERTEQNVRLTYEIFDAFNAHDWEKMAAYYADELEYESPEGRFTTKAALLEYYEGMHSAFPDIQDEIKAIYPSGSSVIIEFVARATAPDGSRMELPILGVLTFENGKVVRDATYYDL